MMMGVISMLIALATAIIVIMRAKNLPAMGIEPTELAHTPKYLAPRGLIIGGHVVYAVTLALGLVLLMQLPVIPVWILAKMVLFVVMISAITKVAKTAQTKQQRLTGLLIADLAWISIIFLVVVQPGGFV
jgi:hypothetical protein